MAQHDYVIANGTGAAVRSDLNNALAAIVSQNSGATEPTTTYAYQFWADTTTNLLKIRNAANNDWITLRELDGTLTIEDGTVSAPGLAFADDLNTGIYSPADNTFAVATDGSGRLFVDASGNVGVGAASPQGIFDVQSSAAVNAYMTSTAGNTNLRLVSQDGGQSALVFGDASDAFTGGIRFDHSDESLQLLGYNYAERARIDSNGRLLVGATSSNTGSDAQYSRLQVIGNTSNSAGGGYLSIGRGVAASTNFIAGSYLGFINFTDNASGEFASIRCEADGTSGTDDYPGRLLFSTTSDGASSPTERMRIDSQGRVLIGKTGVTYTTNGVLIGGVDTGDDTAQLGVANTEASDTSAPLVVNRQGSNGRLVQLRQGNTVEGTISVSGTTVTYGGGHLARWSQLPNDEDPSGILKGTVLSNLDEMCEWSEEDNEQLNRMKVSDVEGDPNVAGVFVSTSFDAEGPLDFFCAMTGDMIIRIAEGVTVQRGDLLMSAGDGTAKPQDDDIVRSKTIAKVTSNHVTCTYDDGSYCVPCVLMAC